MPYCEIPPARLQHLGLFGFKVELETTDALVITCQKGDGDETLLVDKKRPHLWFDDIADAVQMGAIAIITMPPDSK